MAVNSLKGKESQLPSVHEELQAVSAPLMTLVSSGTNNTSSYYTAPGGQASSPTNAASSTLNVSQSPMP